MSLKDTALFQKKLTEIITEVKRLGDELKINVTGFEIDGCFCDWGNLPTDTVVGMIDDFAGEFGDYNSEGYTEAVDELTTEITSYFNK